MRSLIIALALLAGLGAMGASVCAVATSALACDGNGGSKP